MYHRKDVQPYDTESDTGCHRPSPEREPKGGVMMAILKAYVVPPNLLRAIGTMYEGTRARVVTPDGDSEEFDILAGVLQGDSLPPFL